MLTKSRRPGLDPARQKFLEARHAEYGQYNQQIGQQTEWMLEHGHPFANGYRQLRALFDTLKYASNSAMRYMAYVDEYNYASYHSPDLGVDHRRARVTIDWFGKYWNVYPRDAGYMEFLQEVETRGWPKELHYRLGYGYFDVITTSSVLVHELQACLDPSHKVEAWEEGSRKGWVVGGWGGFGCQSVQGTRRIWQILKRRLKIGWLPARTPEDDEVDRAPLPLPYKKFSTGYGKFVKVTDHYVIVPKIPLTNDGNDVVREAVYDLLDLCEKGYPWQGEVRRWVSQWYPHQQKKRRAAGEDSKIVRDWDRRFKDQNVEPAQRSYCSPEDP